MKFRFSLEKLLEHKRQLEGEAQREYALAQARLDEANAELNRMYSLVDESRKRAGVLSENGGALAPALGQIDEFINGQKMRIERFRVEMRKFVTDAEIKREALIEAAKERRTIEKLKEKKESEFRLKKKKHEMKVIDDLVVTRHKRQNGV